MAGYLDRIGAGKILRDKAPFSFDWTPPALVCRDDELEELASMFSHTESKGTSGRAIITGPVGTGKTILTRKFSEGLHRHLHDVRKITVTHVNCRNQSSGFQVLQQIATSLDSGHPERGLSSGEIILSIRRNLLAHDLHLLLILDEVDALIRRDNSDLIYKLLRIDEGKEHQGSISLILVSQDSTLLTLFEPAIISRLGASNLLELAPYNQTGLSAIAHQRADAACITGTVGEEVLTRIGALAAGSGDARIAIELLDAAVRRAEKAGRGEVTIEDVLPSTLRSTSLEPSQVDSLSKDQKLIMLGLCRRLKKSGEVTSGDAKKLYALVCEEFEVKQRSYTTFWKHLKFLESEGLIETRKAKSTVGRGRTTHITMNSIAPANLERRIEKDLQRRK